MTLPEPLLEKILTPDALTVRFQPIVECTATGWRTFAFECLTRGPAGTSAQAADVLFDYVRRKRSEQTVDRICVALAVDAAARLIPNESLAVNVHASTLGDPVFVRDLARLVTDAGLTMPQVIVEIVEHTPVLNESGFRESIAALKALGFRIALDDVGLGHSNFKMMIDCRPDYFKIDRYFIDGIRGDARRAAVVESITRLALRIGGRAIAEGVETPEDDDFVRSLGVDLLQGYLYSRPLNLEQLGSFAPNGAITFLEGERF